MKICFLRKKKKNRNIQIYILTHVKITLLMCRGHNINLIFILCFLQFTGKKHANILTFVIYYE